MLFFCQGTVEQGKAFFDARWPEARAVADPNHRFYAAFGISRGGLAQLMSPSLVLAGARAASKGHVQGTPVGDQRMMPGLFLVRGERVLWSHEFRHAGDHPDFAGIPAQVRQATP